MGAIRHIASNHCDVSTAVPGVQVHTASSGATCYCTYTVFWYRGLLYLYCILAQEITVLILYSSTGDYCTYTVF